MKWSEYLDNSERTLSTQFNLDKNDDKILHSIIGMLTEIDELLENYSNIDDQTNKMEEISDFMWYLSIIDREFGVNFSINDFVENESIVDDFKIVLSILRNCLKLLDLYKKKIFYNKEVDSEYFIQKSKDIYRDVILYCNINNIDLEKSLSINIDKLKQRYPDKFSSERAINRDLQTERNILEGNN